MIAMTFDVRRHMVASCRDVAFFSRAICSSSVRIISGCFSIPHIHLQAVPYHVDSPSDSGSEVAETHKIVVSYFTRLPHFMCGPSSGQISRWGTLICVQHVRCIERNLDFQVSFFLYGGLEDRFRIGALSRMKRLTEQHISGKNLRMTCHQRCSHLCGKLLHLWTEM